jgi:hypothetical protein
MEVGLANIMTSFIAFLEELEESHRTVRLSGAEGERLDQRFGPAVRSMGARGTDGSIEIPMANVTEAVRTLEDAGLSDAVSGLKASALFGEGVREGSAERLIEALAGLCLAPDRARPVRRVNAPNPLGTPSGGCARAPA